MSYESKAKTKAMLLEILAECDQTFSDVFINRVHPIVKQLVEHEFAEQRNKLVIEIAVTLGQIMQGRRITAFDKEPIVDPIHYTSHMMGK